MIPHLLFHVYPDGREKQPSRCEEVENEHINRSRNRDERRIEDPAQDGEDAFVEYATKSMRNSHTTTWVEILEYLRNKWEL